MLLLKNGHVIDPLNGLDDVMDVAINDGKIFKVAPALDAKSLSLKIDNEIDVKGCFVVPGLVDHHTHLKPFAKIGLPAEAVCFSSGVTTAVDAGSSGCSTYESHRGFFDDCMLHVKAYLNVCSTGLDSLPELEDVDPAHWDEGAIKACFEKWGSDLVGLKLRTSAPIVKDLGYEPLRAMVKLADKLGVSVMVHSTNPPGEFGEILNALRSGDVITHIYMNQASTLVQDGRIIPEAYAARERGVLFEASDARLHFGLPVAQTAIAEGFLPDIIATDLTQLSMFLRPTSFSLAMQISKYTHLGIPFKKVIECCTVAPARQLGILDNAGSLTIGHPADIAVLQPIERENIFGDRPNGNPDQCVTTGNCVYQPVLTLSGGKMVYRSLTI